MKKAYSLITLLLILSLILSACSKSSNKSDSVSCFDPDFTVSDTTTETVEDSKSSSESPATNSAEVPATTTSESVAELSDSDGSSSIFDTLDFLKDFTTSKKDSSITESFVATDGFGDAAFAPESTYSTDVYKGIGSDSYIDYGSIETDDIAYDPIAIEPYEPIIIDPIDPVEPIIDPIDPIIIDPIEPIIDPMAGLLTAGEWNDNLHYDFLKELLANGQEYDYSSFFTDWGLSPFNRLEICVKDTFGNVLNNALVQVRDAAGNVLSTSRTDNNGLTYAFYSLNGQANVPADISVSYSAFSGAPTVTHVLELSSSALLDGAKTEIILDTVAAYSKKLDLMFVIDTTGSMGDEINYLQVELEDVITRVKAGNANLPTRLSVNFYRDLEDDYVVRSYPFSSNIDEQLNYLRIEYAAGGGDYEEAVELALNDAINNHAWDEDSIKLMFMVLDAPPHNTPAVRQSLAASIEQAAAMGIRIIPIASSGVDKSTEFLLRTLAMTTGGTYTFLTDDSGIGGAHLEPTIGSYDVENLNDMLVRIINSYLE